MKPSEFRVVSSCNCSSLATLASDKQAERIDDDLATLRKIRAMADSLVTPHPVKISIVIFVLFLVLQIVPRFTKVIIVVII